MLRLKNGEEPADEKYAFTHMTISPRESDSDVIWLSMEEWFSKPKIVDEWTDETVKKMILKEIPIWAEAARAHKKDEVWWPVKYASVVAYFPEGKLGIYPDTLGKDISGYEFERVWTDISRYLEECGAWTTSYTGMMD